MANNNKHYSKIATFGTREEAKAIVERLDSMTYELGHGEYARPGYKVRKVRNMDLYQIYARRSYYAGTINARPSAPLTWDDAELANH